MKRTLGVIIATITISVTLAWTANIISWKDYYDTGSDVWIELEDKPENAEDWVGIYRVDNSNAWNNIVDWRWSSNTSQTEVDEGDWYKFQLEDGEYEARFFLNNSFIVENRVSFAVGVSISSSKKTYIKQEEINIKLTNLPANNGDWVGIYPKGSTNAWDNVKSWSYTNGTKSMNTTGIQSGLLNLEGIAEGEYEARLFFNNSYNLEKKVSFNVVKGDSYSKFQNNKYDVVKYPYNDTTIYYAPDKVNAPVVMFVTGWHSAISQYDELLTFIASHGYYVIPIYESGNFSQPSIYAEKLENILKVAMDNDSIDATKIGVIGHSSGGGDAFYIMNHFKNQNREYNNVKFASNSDFVISLDGWFPFEMNENDMNNLESTAMIMQFGGADGVDNMQDPRINLSIYTMLKNGKKALSIINAEDHGYLKGDLTNKDNLLRPIHAMFDYKFEGKNNSENLALDDKYHKVEVNYEDNNYNYLCNDNGFNYCYPNSFR